MFLNIIWFVLGLCLSSLLIMVLVLLISRTKDLAVLKMFHWISCICAPLVVLIVPATTFGGALGLVSFNDLVCIVLVVFVEEILSMVSLAIASPDEDNDGRRDENDCA